MSFNTNDKYQNYEKSPPSLKIKTQHESHSVVTNNTADLTHPEAGWEEVLADLVTKNNIQLTNKVDEKNQELNPFKCEQHSEDVPIVTHT